MPPDYQEVYFYDKTKTPPEWVELYSDKTKRLCLFTRKFPEVVPVYYEGN